MLGEFAIGYKGATADLAIDNSKIFELSKRFSNCASRSLKNFSEFPLRGQSLIKAYAKF